ncbi:MAG: M28 family peptidase [Spirochaetia bacterium]|nr:M28 family peptidase [Spirochaetia bacterium]
MNDFSKNFQEYISPGCNRMEFICSYLRKNGISPKIVQIDGKNHILVQYSSRFYNPQFKIKTVIAHYDRVENSPGANDNSAADFQIMNWAVLLKTFPYFHNVRIFFTDGEELGKNTGISGQGAFGLASTFRRLGITNDDVYVFDACGRGTVPVLSRTILPKNAPAKFKKNFNGLFSRTENLLRSACGKNWITLPVPYSDNASFIACAIPAVAITMLPANEASEYAMNLSKNPMLENKVLNRTNSISEDSCRQSLPLTWQLFHTPEDNISSLTAESFSVMAGILNALAVMESY